MTARCDGRQPDELRPIRFETGFQRYAGGSVLAVCGNTRVICAANAVEGVPSWMRQEGNTGGWLTAEYQMLPGSTPGRSRRELASGKPSGRSSEIQRLIGRSLRAAVDLDKLPGRTLYVDCDVLDADGGTRCAAISGAAVAVEIALRNLFVAGELREWPMRHRVAAVSVGIVDGTPLLDLCYEEDFAAAVDMNVVKTADGCFVEVQGTAEEAPFTDSQLAELLALAGSGLDRLFASQKEALESYAS